MKFKLLSMLAICFVITACSSQKGMKKGKEEATEASKKKDKDAMKVYSKVITKDAVTDSGLFAVHKVKKDYFYEIPDSLFNKEMLMVSRIAKTASNLGFGGGKANTQVLRWDRKDDKVLLRIISHQVFAADSLAIHEAVKNSNFEPILYAFDIETISKDSTSTVIKVNEFLEGDVKALGIPSFYRTRYKVSNVDKNRSYVESIKSYPENIEMRHVKTYNAKEPPSNGTLGSITVEMNTSMILLPETPMKRRYFDERVGWFARGQTDYGLDAQESKTVRYLDRWRLEVKPEDRGAYMRGELVEPKKQIVYYVDRATPEQWKKYIKQGINDWQVAFEAAGFKNAIIAKDPPTVEEDPEWSPEDVRYSVVRYLASPIPNANGPHVSDPRSGEILESDINWYHNVMTLLRNWYFVQTAAINPEARGVKFKDEIMGRLVRFVSSHEVGHTLGLPHNMGSSVAYPVDSLRDPEFTAKNSTAPSIMDYARFNYVAQPGDGDVALMPNIGVYDKYAINWGYREILNKSAEDEKPILDQWILEHAGDPMYRFGRQQRGVIDPSSQTEDLGDDAVKASRYGIMNLKRIVPKLIEYTAEDGKNYSDLGTMYDQVVGQFNRYMGHVAANVGGVYEYYKTYDQSGAVYTAVDRNKQRESLLFINEQLFTTPRWLLDQNIFNKIQFDGSVNDLRGVQVRTLNNLLDFGRMARMSENEAVQGAQSYSLLNMMDDLRNGIFSELSNGNSIDTYRRNLQRAYVDRLAYLMTQNQGNSSRGTRVNVSQSDIRSVARAELKRLQNTTMSAARSTSDTMSKIHLEDLSERIKVILDPSK